MVLDLKLEKKKKKRGHISLITRPSFRVNEFSFLFINMFFNVFLQISSCFPIKLPMLDSLKKLNYGKVFENKFLEKTINTNH